MATIDGRFLDDVRYGANFVPSDRAARRAIGGGYGCTAEVDCGPGAAERICTYGGGDTVAGGDVATITGILSSVDQIEVYLVRRADGSAVAEVDTHGEGFLTGADADRRVENGDPSFDGDSGDLVREGRVRRWATDIAVTAIA